MKCLRCGYCCIHYDVIIVKPEFAMEDFDIDSADEDSLMQKSWGVQCPHLEWDGDKPVCKIHHFSWYKDTPCFAYSQIERSIDTPCRMGEYLLEDKESKQYRNWIKVFIDGGKSVR